jgi:transposase/transposase-like protein
MYDLGFKQAVLRVYAKQRNIRSVARCFDLPPATIFRWVTPKLDKQRKIRYPSQPLMSLADQIISGDAFSSCTDISSTIRHQTGLVVSRQRVSNLLKQLGLTRKRSRTRVIREASFQQAQDHCNRFPVCINPSLLFAIDEMGVSEKTSPLYGYSKVNTRLIHKRTSGGWKNISTVATIGYDGSIQSKQSERSYNTQTFSDFLMDTTMPVGSHVILDNVAFHRSKSVAKIFEDRGWTPLFIPPYQPDFNPIENVFSSVKHRVRRSIGKGTPTRDAINDSFSHPSLPSTIKNCFSHMIDLVCKLRTATP